MESAVKKWGNSASVRIPAAIMDAARIELDQVVDLRVENGTIVMTPVKPRHDLAEMLSRVTDENMHGLVDFGAAAAQEQI